jgi:hypothetical protein
MARKQAQVQADPEAQALTADDETSAESTPSAAPNEPSVYDQDEIDGQPNKNIAEKDTLEVNEHSTITGTAPTGNSDAEYQDVDPALYVGSRSWNSEQVSTTYTKKFTARAVDWESIQADADYEQAQHNANITGTRLAALQTGLTPVEDSGSFVGVEELPENNVALVYKVDVVPNNDDAPQTYVNPNDVAKANDLSEPGWAPTTTGESRSDPDLQAHNEEDATWSQPEPVHLTDIEAKRQTEEA